MQTVGAEAICRSSLQELSQVAAAGGGLGGGKRPLCTPTEECVSGVWAWGTALAPQAKHRALFLSCQGLFLSGEVAPMLLSTRLSLESGPGITSEGRTAGGSTAFLPTPMTFKAGIRWQRPGSELRLPNGLEEACGTVLQGAAFPGLLLLQPGL